MWKNAIFYSLCQVILPRKTKNLHKNRILRKICAFYKIVIFSGISQKFDRYIKRNILLVIFNKMQYIDG